MRFSQSEAAAREVDAEIDTIAAGLIRGGVAKWDAFAQAQQMYRDRQRCIPTLPSRRSIRESDDTDRIGDELRDLERHP